MQFVKMHGLGNDFAIFDATKQDISLSVERIKSLASRKWGIGFDQLIILRNCEQADIEMEIYNQDGSSASACGNAARCVARLLEKERGSIKVQDRILPFWRHKDNTYSVNMGAIVEYNPKFEIAGGNYIYVNIGNPHLICFKGQDLSSLRQFKEYNINSVTVAENNTILLETRERGVGLTSACGSGACASFYACYMANKVGKEVAVIMKGGVLFVSLNAQNEIIMQGEAVYVYRGEIDLG